MTDEILLESRRDLRERAFQALMALEYDGTLSKLVALLICMIRTWQKMQQLIFRPFS